MYQCLEVLHHGSKSDITKGLSVSTIRGNPGVVKSVRSYRNRNGAFPYPGKCCVQADIPCFSDLVIILYDEVLRLGTDHDRVEFVFSSYFNSLNAKVAIIQKLVN